MKNQPPMPMTIDGVEGVLEFDAGWLVWAPLGKQGDDHFQLLAAGGMGSLVFDKPVTRNMARYAEPEEMPSEFVAMAILVLT